MAGSAQLFPVLQLPKAPSGTWLQDPSYVIWGCKQTLTGIGKITKFRITPVALRAPSVTPWHQTKTEILIVADRKN